MSEHAINIGILPGYKNTTLYAAADGIVVAAFIVENIKLFSQLADITDKLLYMANFAIEDVHYITLFSGPAPLTTTRTICAWIQGLVRAHKNLSTVMLHGLEYILKSLHQDDPNGAIVLLQAYGGLVHWYDTFDKIEKEISIDEVEKKLKYTLPNTKIYMGNGLQRLGLILTESSFVSEIYSYSAFFFAAESHQCFIEKRNLLSKPLFIQPYQKN